jgi:hypothetical protein
VIDDCRECKQPLVEIDNRGEHLTGCMICNIWWSAEGEKARLSEEDLRALGAGAQENAAQGELRRFMIASWLRT